MGLFKNGEYSPIAFNNLLACCGVKTILDFTLALGIPGMILTKSRTNLMMND
jgi:hypothetical protein